MEKKEIVWEDRLNSDELIETESGKFVKLNGLVRLAHEKGLRSTDSTFNGTFVNKHDEQVVVMKFEVSFKDGTKFSAHGDACSSNTDEGYNQYLIPIAESRAKARALRDALNIRICSVEEVQMSKLKRKSWSKKGRTITEAENISEEQKTLINKLKHKHKLNDDTFKKFAMSKAKIRIHSIDNLTKKQATEIISTLQKGA